MKKLLIDIGNTTTHLKLIDTDSKQYILEKVFLTKQLLTKPSFLNFDFYFDEIVYCSVVKEVEAIITKQFYNAKSILDFTKVKQSDFVYPINLLGADFIANFYAINDKDLIVVSLGTATTFMTIKNAKMIGAIIAPGMEASIDGLVKNAPALVYNFQKQVKWEANIDELQTIEAINKGLVNGHWYMIKGIVEEIKVKHKIKNVILTGGYANLIEANDFKKDNDLIFKGIDTISQS